MNIIINQALRDYIDPLTNQEYLALERSLLKEGCRDALVLWGETLIDGHNRYAICQKHNIPFQTKQNDSFQSVEDVMLWMIDNHLARRSVSSFQRGVLALRKKEIITTRRKDKTSKEKAAEAEMAAKEPDPVSVETRDEIAKVAGLSKPAVAQIEKIRKSATPELVEAVRAGTISINTAATISSLPSEQQQAAVAGGKKELQQAARQLRQVRTPRASSETTDSRIEPTAGNTEAETGNNLAATSAPALSELERLRAENQALKAEIAALKMQLTAD
jgi:transcriptional regulator with XRE-family HTH domain